MVRGARRLAEGMWRAPESFFSFTFVHCFLCAIVRGIELDAHFLCLLSISYRGTTAGLSSIAVTTALSTEPPPPVFAITVLDAHSTQPLNQPFLRRPEPAFRLYPTLLFACDAIVD
jgi:hypothetical protein